MITQAEREALAEHERWRRELEAERVTHTNESHAQLVRRLEGERPDTPWQRLQRAR